MIDAKFVTAKSGIKNKTDLIYVVGLIAPIAKKQKGKSDDEIWSAFLTRYKATARSNGSIDGEALLSALDLNEGLTTPLAEQVIKLHAGVSDSGVLSDIVYAVTTELGIKSDADLDERFNDVKLEVIKRAKKQKIKTDGYEIADILAEAKAKPEKVTCYIDFLNKDKRYRQDRKEFTGKDFETAYEMASKWGRKNIGNFSNDTIRVLE